MIFLSAAVVAAIVLARVQAISAREKKDADLDRRVRAVCETCKEWVEGERLGDELLPDETCLKFTVAHIRAHNGADVSYVNASDPRFETLDPKKRQPGNTDTDYFLGDDGRLRTGDGTTSWRPWQVSRSLKRVFFWGGLVAVIVMALLRTVGMKKSRA